MNWMLTDMNSYFASVEQTLRPELRGKPIGVIPVESEGTCVIAASQDAKRRGVKVGTGVREARRLCPGITFVKARPPVYVDKHYEILAAVERCAPVHRVYSIDEWTIRLTGAERDPDVARDLALQIKQQLRSEFGPWLTCSVGIAPSRLLAKLASNLQKPDGLTILSPSELPERLESEPLGSLTGIGKGVLARLEQHGIRNVRDVWNLTRPEAIRIWGSATGGDWWAGLHGLDEPEIATRRHSMTHASVLDPKFRNAEGAHGILVRLVSRLGQRLRRDGYYARSLHLSLQYLGGGDHSDMIAVSSVQDTPTLLLLLDRLWNRRPEPEARPLKVGVTVGGLIPKTRVARSLFEEDEKRQRLSQTMDAVNQRCGPSKLYLGPMHDFRHLMEDKIAFGRIPDVSK